MFYMLCMLFALWGSDAFPPIIIALSVMCVMRLKHDIHVMRPIPFLLIYSVLQKLRYKCMLFAIWGQTLFLQSLFEVLCVKCALFMLYTLWSPHFSSSELCAVCCTCYACFTRCEIRLFFPVSSLFLVFCVLCMLCKICTFWAHTLFSSKLCLIHIMFQIYISRVKRSNSYPSNTVLSVMRDMRGMHVIHVMSHTLLLL